MYKTIFNKFLIHTNPEKIHNFVCLILKIYGSILQIFPFIKLNKTNYKFGIAAGFDKNASSVLGLYGLGFGFIEIGTITPQFQQGNKKPRSWRYPKEKALRNYMGFPNFGADKVAQNLRKIRNSNIGRKIIIGANIGKQNETNQENAVNDYLTVAQKLNNYVDYLVVNVSCPNTPDLLALQNEKFLRPILVALKTFSMNNGKKPIYVKVSPDLSTKSIKEIAQLVNKININGVIATNTTQKHNYENGGLSGKPLKKLSIKTVSKFREYLSNEKEIIGCGGIFSKNDYNEFILAGANKAQGFTGFIYEGPFWVKKISKKLD